MALSSANAYQSVVIEENGLVRLRLARRIYDDGLLVAEVLRAIVLEPGQDVSSYPAKIRNTCTVWWDQATIDAYNAAKAAGGL
jgi:hypothetical protein